MRPGVALVWITLTAVGSGCAFMEDGTRNLVLCAKKPIEIHHEKARNREWAEQAWLGVSRNANYSPDYAQGFKDGFAEYLFRGGDGEISLAPPLHYRNIRYQTAEGYAAIQDWFSGYRHGTLVARDSGARQWITGPSALRSAANNPITFGPSPVQGDALTQPHLPEVVPLP